MIKLFKYLINFIFITFTALMIILTTKCVYVDHSNSKCVNENKSEKCIDKNGVYHWDMNSPNLPSCAPYVLDCREAIRSRYYCIPARFYQEGDTKPICKEL